MPSVTRKPQVTRQQRRVQMERRLLDATERLMRGGASFTALSVDRLSTQAAAPILPDRPPATTASALVWMVERACQQNLPANPPDYDAELAATLAEIIWGALYLKAL